MKWPEGNQVVLKPHNGRYVLYDLDGNTIVEGDDARQLSDMALDMGKAVRWDFDLRHYYDQSMAE